MNPLVSIITVNYNHSETTLQFLETIKQQSYPAIEVVLVDNASQNFNPKDFTSAYPSVKIIENKVNLGFAAANNQGIKVATGTFLFFLNFDVLLEKNTIIALVRQWSKLKKPGMVCPVLVFEEQPDKVQYSGYTEISNLTGRNDDLNYGKNISSLPAKPFSTAYAHGAAIFTTTEIVSKIGGMPEQYFLYYEEMEWSERIKNAGYHIYVTPQIKIIHKESISVGQENPLKTFYLTRNRILFMKRNKKAMHFMLFWLYWCLLVLPVKSFKAFIKLDFKRGMAYIEGTFWHIKKAF